MTDWHSALAAAARQQPVPRGTEPSERVLTSGPFQLRRYAAPAAATLPPVLLVYSLVNRPDLLDLAPGASLVADLRSAGFPVYLVDWGYPALADGWLDLEDYVDFLGKAVEQTRTDAGWTPLIAGICQGGTLSLMLSARRPGLMNALALIATPVDFHAGNAQLARLARCWPLPDDPISPGLVSGDRLSAGFTALRPADLLLRRYLQLPKLSEDPQALETFLRMESWMYDCPDQPAPVFHRFLLDCYLENALVQGRLVLAGKLLHLNTVRCALLNVYARADHLVPPESSSALEAALEGIDHYNALTLPGGHLGLFLSRRNRRALVHALEEHATRYL